MFPNLAPSQNITVAGKIAPVSQAAGSVSTGWIDAAEFSYICAIVQSGVMGASATIDAILQQATDSGGTGAKAITGAALTQLVKATDDNREAILEIREDALDLANNFRFVRLTVTVATAACLISALVLATHQRRGPANARNLTTVKGIVRQPASI